MLSPALPAPALSRCALGLALLATLAAGCGRRAEPRVVYDLARRSSVAEFEGRWDRVRFGTPGGEQLQERGFVRVFGGEPAAGIRARATVPIIFDAPRARRGLVELELEPGYAGRRLEIDLNQTNLLRATVAEGRVRFAFSIPVENQRPGRNRLRLRFPEEEAALPPDDEEDPSKRRSVGPTIARLYRLVVARDPDPAFDALTSAEAPPLVGHAMTPQGPVLLQAGPSRLRFALVLPEDPTLALVPRLGPRVPAGVSVEASVALEEEGVPERRLWSGRLEAGASDAGEVRVELPGAADRAARLVLELGEASDGRHAWVEWRVPRVLGLGAADPLAVPTPEPELADELDALRQRLQGMSVLLVFLDAARADHFGFDGYPRPTTPELDRIAREGVVFERHYTPAVFTYAAMGAVWTSRYPELEQEAWIEQGRLPEDRLTLGELLAGQGIPSAAFIANPSAGPGFGLHRGFDEVLQLYRPPWVEEMTMPTAQVFRRHLFPWLEGRRGGSRFFAYAHYREPHGPLDQPPLDGPDAPLPPEARNYGWFQGGKRPLGPEELDHLVRLYDGNLAFVDGELGALRRKLEELGLWEKTVVIVTADHGEALLDHGIIGHNHEAYEELARIPLIVRFPKGTGPAGRRTAAITNLLDVAPTVADLFGVLGRGGSAESFQGRSLLPVALGGAGRPGTIARTTGSVYGLATARYKLVYDIRRDAAELYDLEADPRERRDLAARQPLRVAAYRQAIYQWLLDVQAAMRQAPEATILDERDREVLKALGYLN